ncbi:MAG: nucleoside-diphosphate kinase [Candidatus Woesearchaeota archaeon]|jgi:nucleoside-diphosphate kinase
MREQTLVLIKPDAVQRGLIGEIVSRFERCGLKIIGLKMVQPDSDLAGKHYEVDEEWLLNIGIKQKKNAEAKGKTFDVDPIKFGMQIRQYLIDFLRMSPVVAIALDGHNAIDHVRKVVGQTSPQDSMPGTIRGDFSFDSYELADNSNRTIQNLIHASSSTVDAKRELGLWFTKEELLMWERVDEALLYRKVKK